LHLVGRLLAQNFMNSDKKINSLILGHR